MNKNCSVHQNEIHFGIRCCKWNPTTDIAAMLQVSSNNPQTKI